jgi:hypothetical protein
VPNCNKHARHGSAGTRIARLQKLVVNSMIGTRPKATTGWRLTDHGPATYAQRMKEMLALQLHAGARPTGAADVAAGIRELHTQE